MVSSVRTLLIALALTICMQPAYAEPASEVAFTGELLQALEATDPEAGREHAQTCFACHGESGRSQNPMFPDLAGQAAPFIYKQIRDYRDGKRSNPTMAPLVQGLDDATIRELAAYYAAKPQRQVKAEPPDMPELVRVGDGDRMITPCASCHGYRGKGRHRLGPILAGQPQAYLEKQLRAFRSGERGNDVYGVMRAVVAELTDEEVSRLARYYSELGR